MQAVLVLASLMAAPSYSDDSGSGVFPSHPLTHMHRALYHYDDDDYVPPSTNYDDADDDITSPSYILEWVFWYFVVPFIMGGLLRMMCKKKQEKEEEPDGWRINQVGDERSALQMPTEHDEEAPAVEPVEAPPPVMFTVTCPEDVEAGAEIVVQGPGGSVQVAVPEELGPDRMFLVQVPGKQPPRRMTVKKRDDNEEVRPYLQQRPIDAPHSLTQPQPVRRHLGGQARSRHGGLRSKPRLGRCWNKSERRQRRYLC